ncbi:MAG: putative hydrolase [Promethearchaeota archaeon]|nr:MAG: putative hydrolase [Candidatus Lokiarchaeota archaeon]
MTSEKLTNDTILSIVEKYARKNSLEDDIHGFAHVKRVLTLSLKIGEHYNPKDLILKSAVLLHDIGRIDEKDISSHVNHAELSAQKTLKFFKNNSFKLKENIVSKIIHAIRAHSFSNNITPISIEAKILSDADKLDALGAIGLYRTIGFTIKNQGNLQDVMKHLNEKILHLKNQMYLEFSKRLAEERSHIITMFYNDIKKEYLST